MTQVSVASLPDTGAVQAPGEAAPPVLAQAGQRAEFAARLLEALSALRGGIPAATPAAGPEGPVLPAEAAALAAEPADAGEASEESAALDATASSVASPSTEVPASFVPLILPGISKAGGNAGATEAAEPAPEPTSDAALEAPPLRLVAFQSAEKAVQRSGVALPEEPAQEPPIDRGAREEIEAARAAETAQRAEKASIDRTIHAPEPSTETALARSPDVAPPAQSARSEAATPAAGRVLPEIPARNEQEIIDQVRFLLNRKGGQASIELHPPQLGQLGLKISVTDHVVRLEITADRLPVAELLSRHLPELQQALEAQGLQIDRAQVDLRERGEGRERSGDPGDPNARRGRDSGGDASPRDSSHPRGSLPYTLGAVDVHA